MAGVFAVNRFTTCQLSISASLTTRTTIAHSNHDHSDHVDPHNKGHTGEYIIFRCQMMHMPMELKQFIMLAYFTVGHARTIPLLIRSENGTTNCTSTEGKPSHIKPLILPLLPEAIAGIALGIMLFVWLFYRACITYHEPSRRTFTEALASSIKGGFVIKDQDEAAVLEMESPFEVDFRYLPLSQAPTAPVGSLHPSDDLAWAVGREGEGRSLLLKTHTL